MEINSLSFIDKVYPVGSIYMSVNNTNPKNLFGGTWEQLKDRFLLGVGDTYTTVNSAGGSATHTHNLSDDGYALIQVENPNTNQMYFEHRYISNKSWKANHRWSLSINNGNVHALNDENQSGAVALAGNTNSTNSLPPYLTVYMWKRTA